MAINENSIEWRATKKWALEQRKSLTVDLKQSGVAIEKTEFLRGQLAAVEELLLLPKVQEIDKAEIEIDPPVEY
tara:strand:- start:861 stop:1082 length:222 start_codon:yes stop_codon:yes gene_type:complete